jgi:putative restriction endonuclease
MFKIGELYTRAEIQEALSVPEERRGGDWATGYTNYDGQIYVFCNVGMAGRTGHDYPNRWEDGQLIWSAKNRSSIRQPLIQRLVSGATPVNIFWRSADRSPFTYAGVGQPLEVTDASPVMIRWGFGRDSIANQFAMLNADEIAEELVTLGFTLGESGVKTRRAVNGLIVCYIKIDSAAWRLVIDPCFEDRVSDLNAIPGVYRPTDRLLYHNSTMRSFPQHFHKGESPIPYGIDFDFSSRMSLQQFVAALGTLPKATRAPQDADSRTESEAIRAARLGQQKFRGDLLDRWNGRCAVTGLGMPELLRASHIKPWCDCEPMERLDPDNGLLLAIHIDGLFDRGFISFDDNGKIVLSPKLNQQILDCLGISAEARLAGMNENIRKYLKHHRALYRDKLLTLLHDHQ